MTWQPGDNEAAAAISGMRDTYGSSYGPPSGFAVGERVTYRSATTDEEARGVVVEVLDPLSGSYHIKIKVPGSEPVHRFASDSELAYF
ncbi:MAG: hypothetical protein ACO3LD_10710 [Luminiphilus sp.]